MNLPTDIANQALDAAGVNFTLGDVEEGTRQAQVILRAYWQCMSQLLRCAHWDFARKQVPMALLGDATGQTRGVVPYAPRPWNYVYSLPPDAAKVRFVPWNQNTVTAPVPQGNIAINQSLSLMGGQGNFNSNQYQLKPSRFLLTHDPNFTSSPGSEWWMTPGVSPIGSTVICSNVPQATVVYTALIPYPNIWDPQFRAALVAYLASEIAVPLAEDKKFGMARQSQQIAIAQRRLDEARVTNGNEGWSSSDIAVDWIKIRNGGGWLGADYGNEGTLYCGWEAGALGGANSNSSAY